MLVILVHTNIHIRFAKHIGHLATVVQKTFFHPVDIAAQLCEFRAALNIDDFVEISGSDGMEFFIDTINIVHNIAIHIRSYCTHQNHRNYHKAEK